MQNPALHIMCAAAALAATASCAPGRNPAGEPPAKLQTGKYEFTYGGAVAGIAVPKGGPGGSPRTGCVTSSMVSSWPKPMLLDTMASSGYCAHRNVQRTGNALSGELVCEADQDKAPGGTFKLAYTGDMTETTTHLETKLSIDIKITDEIREQDPEAAAALEHSRPMLNATTIIIDAKRLGAC